MGNFIPYRYIVQISAGYVHSMALKKDGTVWTWGRNDGGQLGNNNTSNKSLPVQVKGGASGSEYLTDVVQVTAGNWHSMALKANGTVYAWGWGQYGQLEMAIQQIVMIVTNILVKKSIQLRYRF